MNKECKIRLVDFGSVKALASVVYGDLEIKGFRIIDQNGEEPWVSMPSREYQKNGDRQFFNIVFIPDAARRKEFTDWIIKEYHNASNSAGNHAATGTMRRAGP